MKGNAMIASDESNPQDDFINEVSDKYPELMGATDTDEELLYLMMGSVGRLAELFKSGNTGIQEVQKQCIAIAAAAMCIGCPYDESSHTDEDDIPAEVIESGHRNGRVIDITPMRAPLVQNPSIFSSLKTGGRPYTSGTRVRDACFFVYKHHSYGMTMKLEGWIREHVQPEEFGHFRNCGVDKSGAPLIGIIHPDLTVVAFIRCSTPQVKAACADFLKSNYPEKEWR